MSYDFQATLNNPCDHRVLCERYVIDTFDFRTLHWSGNPAVAMRAPINGQSNVAVFLGGKLLAPSAYSFVVDPAQGIAGAQFWKIVLNQPMRMTRPLIEVSYITIQETCIKCGGTGIVPDWTVADTGGIEMVFGQAKLAQQALKYILTSRNPFAPSLTCALRSYIGKKFGYTVTSNDIATEVTRVLNLYKQIQAAQKTVQAMTPEETLKDITSVSSRQDPNNPLAIYLSTVITGYGATGAIPLNAALQGS